MSKSLLSIWKGEIAPCVTPRAVAEEIIAEVAADRGYSVDELVGPSKRKKIVHARQEAMWRLRQLTRHDGSPRLSLPQIAHLTGREDHTTVLHGIRAHQERMAAGTQAQAKAERAAA